MLIPKKHLIFSIWAWTPVILCLISGSNFSSRELIHTEFNAVQLSRMLFKVLAHFAGQRTLKPRHSNEKWSQIFWKLSSLFGDFLYPVHLLYPFSAACLLLSCHLLLNLKRDHNSGSKTLMVILTGFLLWHLGLSPSV